MEQKEIQIVQEWKKVTGTNEPREPNKLLLKLFNSMKRSKDNVRYKITVQRFKKEPRRHSVRGLVTFAAMK